MNAVHAWEKESAEHFARPPAPAKRNLGEHVRSLWPRWPLLPVAPFWAWAAFSAWRRRLRWDHVAIALVATGLAYGTKRTRRAFLAVAPLSAVGLLYDAMSLLQNVGLTRDNVHVGDLRALELRWFGVGKGRARRTLQDVFQMRRVPALDLLCAVPYATFLYVVLGYALYLETRDVVAQRRFAWGFLLLNVAGYVTYHVYPAAPPWYFHKYGNAVHLDAPPESGPNLARVDAMLHVRYFQSFYARGSDVFGAMPSLHVAYPLLMILEGWRLHRARGRVLLVLFYSSMCFSAVYLDHHWVLDIVAGSAYALAADAVLRRVVPDGRAPAVLDLPRSTAV